MPPLWPFFFFFLMSCNLLALQRSSLRAGVKWWETLFIQDETLTLGCQTQPLHGNNESLRNSVQPCTFLQTEREREREVCRIDAKHQKYLSVAAKEKHELCETRSVTSVMFNVSLVHLFDI